VDQSFITDKTERDGNAPKTLTYRVPSARFRVLGGLPRFSPGSNIPAALTRICLCDRRKATPADPLSV
jgi:hypothetical protein